jgi:hypothetical protein
MKTKLSIVVFLATVLTTACPAATLIQTFNGTLPPLGWNTYIGAGSGTSSYTWSTTSNGGYLSAKITRSDANDGKTYVKTALGIAAIPTMTSWSQMPEIWMSTDVKWLNGANNKDPALFGIFNGEFDNDYNPGINFMGVGIGGGYTGNTLQAYLRIHRGNGAYSSTKVVTGTVLKTAGTAGDTYRISMHFYKGETSYLGDLTITNLTNPSEPVLSQVGFSVLSGYYFEKGLDSFGIHNTIGSLQTSLNTYSIDNMYLNIPEPATIAILGLGMIAALRTRKY